MKSAGRKTLNSAAASKHRCPVSLQAVSFGNVAPASSSSTADCCALNGADNLQVAKTDPRDQILRRKPPKQIPAAPGRTPSQEAGTKSNAACDATYGTTRSANCNATPTAADSFYGIKSPDRRVTPEPIDEGLPWTWEGEKQAEMPAYILAQ